MYQHLKPVGVECVRDRDHPRCCPREIRYDMVGTPKEFHGDQMGDPCEDPRRSQGMMGESSGTLYMFDQSCVCCGFDID